MTTITLPTSVQVSSQIRPKAGATVWLKAGSSYGPQAFTPDQARRLAALLIQTADEAEKLTAGKRQ